MANDAQAIYNHDVVGLVRRIDRFRKEIAFAVSSGVSSVRGADLERIKSYLTALEVYESWLQSQPQLDLPESHPTYINVEPSPEMPMPENESFADLLYMLDLMRVELINSQSARLPQGLTKFDSGRFLALRTKMVNFLKDYVEVITPLDLPESSPRRPMVADGNKGT